MPIIKAIITTLDNLENLKNQIPILHQDKLVDEIIVVNNGSQDGTKEWIDKRGNILTAIHRDNLGAGPGRNAGLDAAGKADYYLMLDGGICPLFGGVEKMLDYLQRREDADVIGIEIPNFETDRDKAWHRWPYQIGDNHTYINTRLSHTAYCLAKYRAFDGLRFSEEGPFAEPGWGADDDEMAYQWLEAGISVHVVTNVHPYRHASGSFRRLYKETGIWPNQYGSVYEKRVVWLHQNWPQYEPVGQWGEPWLTVVVKHSTVEQTAMMVKFAHDELRKRRFVSPYDADWNPYHIHVWGNDPKWLKWAEYRRLRQHHGNTIVVNGVIIKRDRSNEATWTGDFILNTTDDWKAKIRPNSFYGLVENMDELKALIDKYNEVHPHQLTKNPPIEKGEL